MNQDHDDMRYGRQTAAKGNFVERMFRYWIQHHLTMARYRIGHY